MKKKTTTGLLDGKEATREYLNGVSDHVLRQYLKLGMPVLIRPGGRWLAHRQNIEQFFIKLTDVSPKD